MSMLLHLDLFFLDSISKKEVPKMASIPPPLQEITTWNTLKLILLVTSTLKRKILCFFTLELFSTTLRARDTPLPCRM
jgi:hypothetical protein